MAGEAAEKGTEPAAQKATPGEGKAQRNGELGDRRGQPAGADMGGEWHRRFREGCRPRQVGNRTGSSETAREGDGELGEGVVGEGARATGGGGEGEAEGGPLRRRARGLPAGKGRARAAAREGPRRQRIGRLSERVGKEGEGEPKGAEHWAGVASPSPRSEVP